MIHWSARQTETIIVIYINNIITHNRDVNDLQDVFNGKTFKILFLLSVMHVNRRSNKNINPFFDKSICKSLRNKIVAKWKGKILVTFEITTGH